MKYLLPLLFTIGGCTTTTITTKTVDLIKTNEVWYQAFDEKWKHDPGINPVFETKAEAEEYAELNGIGNSHSYEVREVDYRYEVRVGFSDYTYSNGTWESTLHTTDDFNDAYEYVVEFSSAHSDLIIYDLKTGKQFEETP